MFRSRQGIWQGELPKVLQLAAQNSLFVVLYACSKIIILWHIVVLDSGWQIHKILLSFFITLLWSSAIQYLKVTKGIFMTANF